LINTQEREKKRTKENIQGGRRRLKSRQGTRESQREVSTRGKRTQEARERLERG